MFPLVQYFLPFYPFCIIFNPFRVVQLLRILWQYSRHRRHGFPPWIGKILCRRKWQPTPIFLPEKSHGQKSLMVDSAWGHKLPDMTEHINLTDKFVKLNRSYCICLVANFELWVKKIAWKRTWQPTPVFLPGESHGWRSLTGYSPWGYKESDTTEVT